MNKDLEVKDYKIIVIIALILGIIGLSIAFAAMSSTLKINTSSSYGGHEWSINFANNDYGSTTGSAIAGSIYLKSTSIVIMDAKLNKPGDSVTYTFDVVNNGIIDAELSSITNLSPIFTGSGNDKVNDENIIRNNYIYSLTYEDGSKINIKDELKVGEKVRMKLTMAYKRDVLDTPNNPVTITNTGTTLVYVQK